MSIASIVLASGCTGSGLEQSGDGPASGAPVQNLLPQNTDVTVSWKDFYPDHDENTRSGIIEKAKDEIMRVFPGIDRSSLNGIWIERERYNYSGIKQIGRPYIEFTEARYTLGEGRSYTIQVDPEQMKIIDYSPTGAQYGQAVISYKEAKKKAIEFIRKAQGEDSIVDDPGAYSYFKDSFASGGIPVAYVAYFKTSGGVTYQENRVSVRYDMRRDKVETYYDDLTEPGLLSGLTVLSPEPNITFEEATGILEGMLSEKYNVEEIGLEYVVVNNYDDYLSWWDNDNLVYADDPEALPLVWNIGITDAASRKEAEEHRISPLCGTFRVDAHTGEVTCLVYNEDIFVKTYGYMGSSNPQ